MAISKAQQNATAKYCKKSYDTTIVRFNNGYINDLIKADMQLSAVEKEETDI